MIKNKLWLAVFMLFGLLLSGCGVWQTEIEEIAVPTPVIDGGVIVDANLVPADFTFLRFALPGQVAEIAVTEGEGVEAGQLLARLGNAEPFEVQLLAANMAVMEAEQRVKELERLRLDQDALDLAEAALDLAKGQQRAARKALEDLKLKAPFPGTVVRIDLTEGTYTSPAEIAMVLADLSSWHLETLDLTENEVIGINAGDQVDIIFDVLPDLTFTGEVEKVSEYFLERFGSITYVVRISLTGTDDRLRWGMTAEDLFPD